jgi:hypothetical protein
MKQLSTKWVFIGTGVALLANAALFLIGSAAGATWNVGLPFTVGLAMVAGATIIPMLLGGQVVRLLGSWKPSIITLSAWLVLVFSIAGAPSGWISSNDLATGLALGAMHVVVGLSWFFSINRNEN